MIPKSKLNKTISRLLLYFITSLSILLLLVFLSGIYFGMNTTPPILTSLLFLSIVVFAFIIFFLIHRIYRIISPLELSIIADHWSASESDDLASSMGLLCKDAFFDEVRKILSSDINIGCLAVWHIESLEFIKRYSHTKEMHQINTQIIETMTHIKDGKVIIGRKAYNEFWTFFYHQKRASAILSLDQVLTSLKKLDFSSTSNFSHHIRCGYSWFPWQGKSASQLIDQADFALYEAMIFKIRTCHEFSVLSYQKQEEECKRNELFDELIDHDKITYHFQPIVNAHTGKIFAYEALMRSSTPNSLSAIDILTIAQRQNRLYDIERITFFKVLQNISENTHLFKGKKVFINSIPNCQLSSADFDLLFTSYSEYLSNIVVEVTEDAKQTPESLKIFQNHIRLCGCEIALDDYGTGYSNDSNLIDTNPHYLKLDQSLIREIDKNQKKQHLIQKTIEYAKQYSITCIAEGVETKEELAMVIHLGADLIQGFYIARPSDKLLLSLPFDIEQEIISLNAKNR